MAGKNCKGYINTATYASKTWAEMKRITDVKLPRSRGSSDYMMRGNEGEVTVVGYTKRAVTFKYHMKPGEVADTVFAALETAFNTGADIECAFMNKAIATVGAKGVSGFFVVTKFDRDEADEENPSVDVELKPADHEESGTPVEVAPYTTPS
jgi:hypothetical protein